MIRSWSSSVFWLACVCVTSPPLKFLLVLKALFSPNAACFDGAAPSFQSDRNMEERRMEKGYPEDV